MCGHKFDSDNVIPVQDDTVQPLLAKIPPRHLHLWCYFLDCGSSPQMESRSMPMKDPTCECTLECGSESEHS